MALDQPKAGPVQLRKNAGHSGGSWSGECPSRGAGSCLSSHRPLPASLQEQHRLFCVGTAPAPTVPLEPTTEAGQGSHACPCTLTLGLRDGKTTDDPCHVPQLLANGLDPERPKPGHSTNISYNFTIYQAWMAPCAKNPRADIGHCGCAPHTLGPEGQRPPSCSRGQREQQSQTPGQGMSWCFPHDPREIESDSSPHQSAWLSVHRRACCGQCPQQV